MKSVVLAAGEGSRLRPLTEERPKPLIEVDGAPLLSHTFDRLASVGTEEIITVIGYRWQDIIDRFGYAYDGIPISYARQSEPRGLADALLAAADHIDDQFILTYGDVIMDADFQACLSLHRRTSADATLLVMDVSREEAKESGICIVNEEGDVKRVVEKPQEPASTLALPGFIVFDPIILQACRLVTPSERGEYELLDAIDLLVHAGRIVEWIKAVRWRVNVNTPSDLRRAERLIAEQASQDPSA